MFRNLRNYRLLREKFSKYLVYALGEVLLVVLGILVAVQIDNWNEERKNYIDFSENLNTVARDLKEDVSQYDLLISDLDRKDSLLIRITSNQINENDYRSNWKELRSLITRSRGFYIHKIGFQALEQKIAQTPKDLKQLTDEISDYYLYKAEGSSYVFEREERFVWKTLEDWESKYAWYGTIYRSDTAVNSERLNYLLNSTEYKNKATTFLTNTRNALSVLNEARLDGLHLFKKLRVRNSISSDSIFSEISDIVYIQDTLQLQVCSNDGPSFASVDWHEANAVLIIRNNTQQTIRVYERYQNVPIDPAESLASVGPHDFVIEQSGRNQWYEVRSEKGVCLGRFQTRSGNALIAVRN